MSFPQSHASECGVRVSMLLAIATAFGGNIPISEAQAQPYFSRATAMATDEASAIATPDAALDRPEHSRNTHSQFAALGADPDAPAAPPVKPVSASDIADHQSAMRVYIDPETGRRTARPSAAARDAAAAHAATRPEFSQSSEGLVEHPAPGGGVIVHLEGRFQSSTEVRLGANGEREVYCTDATHAHAATPARDGREER